MKVSRFSLLASPDLRVLATSRPCQRRLIDCCWMCVGGEASSSCPAPFYSMFYVVFVPQACHWRPFSRRGSILRSRLNIFLKDWSPFLFSKIFILSLLSSLSDIIEQKLARSCTDNVKSLMWYFVVVWNNRASLN